MSLHPAHVLRNSARLSSSALPLLATLAIGASFASVAACTVNGTAEGGPDDTSSADAGERADASGGDSAPATDSGPGAETDSGPATVTDSGPGTVTDSGPGTGDGGDLPPPNLTNVCPQTSSANSAFATAAPITVDSQGRARVGAGVTQGDDDWYTFVAPKHDPVWAQVNYTVGAGSASQLGLGIYDNVDEYVGQDDTDRTTSSQTLNVFFEAAAPSSTYAIDLSSNSATCTPADVYVRALYCTDQWEDNDDNTQAPAITLQSTTNATGGTATASFSPTIDGLDDDYFSFAAPKMDPMSATVTYTRPASDPVDLSLTIYDNTNEYVTQDDSARTETTQTLTTVWEATAPGAIYKTYVNSNTQGTCAPYQVALNGLWCTDAFEDNDAFATAATLPAGSGTSNATISQLDADWYKITSPTANGSCVVTYTVPAGSSQQLAITIYDAANDYISQDDTARTGSSQTLTATWAATDAPFVVNVTASAQDCTPYTIECH